MKSNKMRSVRRGAFTLVEMLVVILIIAVLASLLFVTLTKTRETARSVTCLSRLRNVSSLMLAKVGENGGVLRFFQAGGGGFDYRPYYVVRDELGLAEGTSEKSYPGMKDIMFCPAAPEPLVYHWHTYGVNFTPSVRSGVAWLSETSKDSLGNSATLSTLHLSKVGNASNYPLVGDSSEASGQQIFRIIGASKWGLRHSGKANAAFLDGSARTLTKPDLGALEFVDAYDNSVTPPKVVKLPAR